MAVKFEKKVSIIFQQMEHADLPREFFKNIF